jgi:hypothetical protein
MMKGTLNTIIREAAYLLIFVLLSGCASMNAPDSDKVSINSIPEGAKVYEGANLLGTTPMTHTFKRDTFQKKNLTLRKEGYKSQDLQLGTTLEKAALWNFAFFITTMGVTSWGIDAANGNMVKYHPDSYLIDLEKVVTTGVLKDQTRLQRLRFVAVNKDLLQRDIARGDGEYLRAYFEIRPQTMSTGDYQAFLGVVSSNAPHLLSLADTVEFYKSLEVI